MLTDFSITFSEPICSCEAQAVHWNIVGHKSGFALHMWCKLCDTDVKIPSDQIKATLDFEKPYKKIYTPPHVVENTCEVINVDFARGIKRN